jgi:hypothetical protein
VLKGFERVIDQSFPANEEVENEWSDTFMSPCIYMPLLALDLDLGPTLYNLRS